MRLMLVQVVSGSVRVFQWQEKESNSHWLNYRDTERIQAWLTQRLSVCSIILVVSVNIRNPASCKSSFSE